MKNLNITAAQIQQIMFEMQESRNKTFIVKDNDGIEGAALNLQRKISTALEKSSNDFSTFEVLTNLIKAAEMYQAVLYLTAVQASDDDTAVRFHNYFK